MKKTASFILSFALIFSVIAPSAEASAETGRRFVPQSTYLSPVREAPISFTGLGMEWRQVVPEGTWAELSIRFRDARGEWGQWNEVEGDVDGHEEISSHDFSAFMATAPADALQYRVHLRTEDSTRTPVLENITFTYINAKRKVAVKAETVSASLSGVSRVADTGVKRAATEVAETRVAALPAGTAQTARLDTTVSSAKIISRAEWGADEGLRIYTEDRPEPQLVKLESDFYKKYAEELKINRKVAQTSDGKSLTWPLEYPQDITKFVIHHTATTKNLDNPEQAIRDIYYWHSISKGWGDIGYNYIIDQKGNIYEGRYGGDGVVGAHAGQGNIGSIGIAVLGNYQETDVPDAVINSLTALIKVKAAKYGIDPTGSSSFRGKILPNIIGHRDVMATSCPGDKLYSLFPAIRLAAKGDFKPKVIDRRRTASSRSGDYDFALEKTPDILTLKPGGTQNLQITVRNTGKKSWGPETVMLVSNTEGAATFLAESRMVGSKAYGKTVSPGASATFDIPLRSGYAGGIATLEIFPFIDNKTKLEKYVSMPIQVEQAHFDYEFVRMELNKPYLRRGEAVQAVITLKNTGNVTWKRDGANKFMIGTEKPRDRQSAVTPVPSARLGVMKENEVKPGATGNFTVEIKAPLTEGAYKEHWAPVMEGVTWLSPSDKPIDIYVYENRLSARAGGASGDLNIVPLAKGKIVLEYSNIGGYLWKSLGTKGFRVEINRQQNLKIGEMKVEKEQIRPGEKTKVEVEFTAPEKEGTYGLLVMPKVGNFNLLARPERVFVRVSKTKTPSEPAPAPSSAPSTSTKSSTAIGSGDKIRIDISFRANPVISGSGSFAVHEGAKRLGGFSKDEKVSVTYGAGKYSVKGDKLSFTVSSPPRFVPDAGTILRIDNFENRPAWNTSYNDNEYRGVLEVVSYNNEMHTVNELPMEDYLKGLAEISATDPYEKIKAVTVLARTYAYYYILIDRKYPGAPYDLCDDPQKSQKYLGYGFEKRNTTGIKAVNDTAGIVVKHTGKIIKTPYFSSDDGRTRSAEEVWGWKDTPWLISVDDPGCKGMTMNGHGVGLSGCGSLHFANQGKNFREIISYYFQGVTVEKL